MKLPTTLPGVGMLTAAVWINVGGDPRRFQTSQRVTDKVFETLDDADGPLLLELFEMPRESRGQTNRGDHTKLSRTQA